MTNLYELKLGSEKLEALLALFDEIKIIIEIMDRIDLTELKQIDQNITQNLAELKELYKNAKAIVDEARELGEVAIDKFNQLTNLANQIMPLLNDIKPKLDEFIENYPQILNSITELKSVVEIIKEIEINIINISKDIDEKTQGIAGAVNLITSVMGLDYANAFVQDGFLYLSTAHKENPPYINNIGELILPYELP